MKRDLQVNDILTNVVFEFSVRGKDSLNALISKQLELASSSESTARLVGLSLKKPTARFNIILKPIEVEVKSGAYYSTSCEDDEYPELDESNDSADSVEEMSENDSKEEDSND